ncbi:MAG: hypothetical protein IV092_13895 [Burkholderiaceae bacterium]|nr:hypothetical protein [Burkholderiaceae bacterium]
MQIIASGVALIAASVFLIQPALAQAPTKISLASTTSRADPLDPRATVAPLIYRSAFQDFRPNTEAEVGSWKEANDKVGSIGGWRVYAKEAQQADVPASPASAPSAAVAPAPPEAKPGAAGPAGHKHH